ncbi:protein-glutamine glutaminase family protein [Bdellovibrio sp. HCB185ZH]|uniref:protein-glutamine glutaminase family protein n=1 Tax=Bdellovibrio sp. HCB185ZH TaxID=3394235 RepID=UPI0039A429FE
MKLIIGLVTALVLLAPNAFAGLSARRQADESFQDAKARSRGNVLFSELDSEFSGSGPESLAKPMSKLNLNEIPALANYEELVSHFHFIRDSYFVKAGYVPRRLTWLFPDDGCYARAELAAEHLIANHSVVPKKVFAFGELHAATNNSPNGWVEWWYHVAVILRVGNTAYVLDPAINPRAPLTLAQWNEAIGGNKTAVNYAICSKDSFDPDSACIQPPKVDEEMAQHEQEVFLPEEWNRILELGRDPEKELGNQPPWL